MRSIVVFFCAFIFVCPALPAFAADEISGDTKLACEALLCLSSGERPGECDPALSRYFSISRKKWSDTLKARKNFLKSCPASSEPGMPSLVDAVVNGAGQCDAVLLNRVLASRVTVMQCDDDGQYWLQDANNCREERITVIDDKLPAYCKIYSEHEYVWKIGVRYDGDKMQGGKWVNEN